MKPTNIMLAALILLVLIAVGYFIFKPKPPKIDIANEIKKQNDSVAIVSLNQPDTAKLRKLEALKIRIATARYNDSLQRAKNK